ncbi:colicin import membrane protein [Paracoccus thiocyanatus]|uniref:Colicin import membrane protein n=1 Tax=Paracoccus thiocyanatus TaxID=34006 RepID=A0A1N6XLC7_9RHOB|nr:hypothetical protein [Paracoccus thiocyanatus]SIR03090.1 colicin import membrane protein [Paracoccus thiocyanatus]
MAKAADETDIALRDLDALVEQTKLAGLRLLETAALNALQRDLRAMKARPQDDAAGKALAQAMRRAAAEKRSRKAQDQMPVPAADPDAAPPDADAVRPGAAKPGKAERQRIKEAEKAERKRLKEDEKAERKAAKQAAKDAAKAERKAARSAAAKPADQAVKPGRRDDDGAARMDKGGKGDGKGNGKGGGKPGRNKQAG